MVCDHFYTIKLGIDFSLIHELTQSIMFYSKSLPYPFCLLLFIYALERSIYFILCVWLIYLHVHMSNVSCFVCFQGSPAPFLNGDEEGMTEGWEGRWAEEIGGEEGYKTMICMWYKWIIKKNKNKWDHLFLAVCKWTLESIL